MTTPGFTAEASCYKTWAKYLAESNYLRATDRFMPADMSTCSWCVCDPGRCCETGLFWCECKICASSAAQTRMPSLLRA
jgi:hypothetical protein